MTHLIVTTRRAWSSPFTEPVTRVPPGPAPAPLALPRDTRLSVHILFWGSTCRPRATCRERWGPSAGDGLGNRGAIRARLLCTEREHGGTHAVSRRSGSPREARSEGPAGAARFFPAVPGSRTRSGRARPRLAGACPGWVERGRLGVKATGPGAHKCGATSRTCCSPPFTLTAFWQYGKQRVSCIAFTAVT